VSGASCLDERTALLDDQSSVECTPYTCAAGACRTACRSIGDCSWPAICDEAGRCVVQPPSGAATESGCSVGRARAASADGRGFALLAGLAVLFLGGRRRRVTG
jgi:hypothetical protein